MNKKIIISFSATIVLLILLGFTAIAQMITLAEITQKIYKHPFTVTNATKSIDRNLISMHRYMKDVALAKNISEINSAVNHVNEDEKAIYQEFEIIFARYLGDKKDIQHCYETFQGWKPIRDEVVFLMKKGKKDEAAYITKNKGAKYLANLNNQVEKMIIFANNKALSLQNNAIDSEKKSVIVILIMLFSILIIVVSILIVLVKNITKNEKKITEHFYIIDQNIMSAKVDKKCVVIDISNALARHLKLSKDEIILAHNYSLLSDSSNEVQKEILRTIESGEEWRGDIMKLDANNEEQWLYLHITPILDDEYNTLYYNNILQDISARKEIEKISRVDGLTTLYNRRFFDETFPKAKKIAHRENKLLVFSMIDIDFFKQYNDTYGHQAGDTALKKVAKVLQTSLKRPDDYTFRLGGEEFGMLYMISDKTNVSKLSDEIRKNVENLQIEHKSNTVSEYITISMGVYIIEIDDVNSVEDIYLKADEALYIAKQRGRNQVKLT